MRYEKVVIKDFLFISSLSLLTLHPLADNAQVKLHLCPVMSIKESR